MDDIEVKAETAALYGAELETPERIDDTGAPLAAPATTPTGATASTDGIMISNVVSMATMKPEEVVLPDVVGSAMHAVVDLEPGEMPAAETSEGSAVHAVVEHDETPASSSSVATTSGSSIDAVDQDPHAAPPNPISAAEGAVSDCGVAVAGKVVGVIPSKGSPEVVQTEQAPSPEIVDLTEDQSSLSPSPPTPAKTETEDIEANGADKTTTDLPQAVPEALPLNDAKLAAENGSSNADTTLVATADSTGCELKDFRGWRDHHIEMAKKKSDNFANFLRKFENKLEGGKRRRTRKSRSNIIRVRKDELSSHWTILSGKRPWYDGCQYRCGFCNLTVSQTHTLRNHVRGQHGRAFSFRDHQTLKQAQWKCRVCTFIFMREKAVIQQHLEESHGLTIQTYEARKRRRRKKSGGGSGDDDGEEGALGCNTSDEGNFDEEVINEPSNEKKGVNNDGFENAVGYGNNNRERSTFKIHFQNPLSTDAKPKGDASVSESKVSQYEAKRDIEPKEPMDRSIHYANRKGQKVVNLSQIQTSGNPENASSPTKKSTIADSRAEPKVVSIEGGTAKPNNYQEVRVKEEVTDGRPWFDGCTFQCPSCPALFRLTSSIVKHMSRIHGTSFVRSNVELAEVTYWRCEICQGATFMKRKRFDIKYHLNLQHDMSLSEYEKKFLLNTHDTAEQALDDASKHKEMESASGSKKSETPVKIALKSARDGDDGGNERRGKRAGHEKGASNDAEKKCDDCGRAFKSRAGLCAHKRFCPSLKCDDCGQMFVAKGALASHKRMHMERPGAHKCGSCAKTFGCRSDVQKHVLDCPGRPRKRADAGAPKGNGVDKGIMRKDSYKHTSAPPLNTAVLMPNMRSHRQKQKDVNDGSIRNSNDDGNNEKKKSEPPAMDKKAKGDSSASKENKSRQSKYVANGGIEPKKHMDRSTLYVNREGHQVTSLPQSRAMNQPKRTGLEKNSDPYPRRSSARSAGKKISNIIKEIMEKDEDGVCAMDKTGQTPETKMLKSMSARSLKETAEETVKEALKDTPKGAKAFLPLEASANAGKDATKTSAKDVKEAPAVNNESEKRPLGKAGSKLRYPTHLLEASDNKANESNPDVHASAANTMGEKQKLIGPNGKIVVKRELDEKQKVTANKKLKLGETMAESGPEPAPKRAKASKGRDKWWDGCKYRCPHCPTEFSDSAAVKLHVECYHGVESSDIEKCGAVTIFYTEWSCSMCAAAPIPRQRSTVAKHLREAHSLTVDAYERAQAKMV